MDGLRDNWSPRGQSVVPVPVWNIIYSRQCVRRNTLLPSSYWTYQLCCRCGDWKGMSQQAGSAVFFTVQHRPPSGMNNNNDNNNNHHHHHHRVQRRNLNFFATSSLRREHATHRALITCNMPYCVPEFK